MENSQLDEASDLLRKAAGLVSTSYLKSLELPANGETINAHSQAQRHIALAFLSTRAAAGISGSVTRVDPDAIRI